MREKTGGRQQGTPNKVTQEIREKFEMLMTDNLEHIQDDLNAMTPRWRVHYLLEMAKFCVPTLKAQEIELSSEDKMQPIVITGMEIR